MNISAKYLLTLFILGGLLAACGTKERPNTLQDSVTQTADTTAADSTPAYTPPPYVFLNVDSLQAVLDDGKRKLDRALRDNPDSLKGYLNTLSGNDPASIPYAIHFIKYYPAPAGSPVYDTLYKQFTSLHYLVSAAFSKVVGGATCEAVLSRNHVERLKDGDPLPDDPELKNLMAYLNLYSLKVYMLEGPYYTGPSPDLFYNVFHRKASAPLLYFLSLQQKDMSQVMVGDNMLLISYPQLYQRIEAWGQFIATQPPNGFIIQEALRTYRADLSILIRGLGITTIFDEEKQTLNPEIKTLYESIMATGKDPVSKKIITDYYNFLSKTEFKKTDGINTFLDKYDIAALFKQPI